MKKIALGLTLLCCAYISALAGSIGSQSEGIMSGPCIGCAEGIVNVKAGTSCPVPTVTAVSPNNGSTAGGTAVTVSGTGFTSATVVNFGAANPAAFSVTNPTTIAVASNPAGSAGTIDVTVTTPCGTSATSAADQFTYTAAYAGLGDAVPGVYTEFWGLAAYNVAYATGSNPAGTLCLQSSFTTCQVINILSTGAFDSASATTFCTSTCVAKILHGQIAANNMTCSSGTTCAVLTFNCNSGTLPCLAPSTTTSYTLGTNPTISAPPVSIIGVVNRTGTGTTGLFGSTTNSLFGIFWTSLNTGFMGYANTNVTYTAADNVTGGHVIQTILNGASSVANVDNTVTSGLVTGTGSLGPVPLTIGVIDSFAAVTGNFSVLAFSNGTALNSTQQTAACHALFSYWVTHTAC